MKKQHKHDASRFENYSCSSTVVHKSAGLLEVALKGPNATDTQGNYVDNHPTYMRKYSIWYCIWHFPNSIQTGKTIGNFGGLLAQFWIKFLFMNVLFGSPVLYEDLATNSLNFQLYSHFFQPSSSGAKCPNASYREKNSGELSQWQADAHRKKHFKGPHIFLALSKCLGRPRMASRESAVSAH